MPGLLQCRRHLEHFSDLHTGVTLVEQPQRLVMQVRVEVSLQRQEFDDAFTAPGRPVVGCEDHVGAVGERIDRLGEVARPGMRVTHQRAAQRQQVVQIVGGVFGHAQGAELREIRSASRRGFGARRHLEFDLHAVDGVFFPGRTDVDSRVDDGDLAGRWRLAEPAAHLRLRSTFEQCAVHVGRTAGHRRSCVDVLLNGMLGEALRGEHLHLARVHVVLRGNAEHSAEMIDVTVGIDHRDHRPVRIAVGAVQGQRGGRDLGGYQGVDDDDSGVTLDKGDVGQVESANLVDGRHDFVQALFGSQCRLAPQTGMHRCGRGAVEKRIRVVVPHDSAVGGLDDARGRGRDEATVSVVEISGVL